MRLGSEKPQADNHKVPPMPAMLHDSSQIEIAKPVQPVILYPWIYHPKLIIIEIWDSHKDMVTAPVSPEV